MFYLPSNISKNIRQIDLCDNVVINFYDDKYFIYDTHLEIRNFNTLHVKYILSIYRDIPINLNNIKIKCLDCDKPKYLVLNDEIKCDITFIIKELNEFYHLLSQKSINLDDRKYLHVECVKKEFDL